MENVQTPPEFELAPSGPIDDLQRRLLMSGGDSRRLVLRAVATALLAWLPLAVASIMTGVRDATQVSFFHDVAVHVRFLVVVPLLILAEAAIGPRSRLVVCEFVKSGLVPENEFPRFESAVHRAKKLLNSNLVEFVLILVTIGLTWIAARSLTGEETLFWYERNGDAGSGMVPAGWWYVLVARPIAVYLFARWGWRYIVWSWFLIRVSKLRLCLSASHPDRMGGLGFVGFHQTVFAILTLAAGCGVAAAAANRILYSGVDLLDHRAAIVSLIVLSVLAGIAPLLAFTVPLVRLKQRGIFEYGRLGSDYVQSFERKWMGETTPSDEPLLGTGDIQSLADIGGGYERVSGMKVALVDRRVIFAFAFAAIVPMLPLVLTVMDLRAIVQLLMKIML